MWSYKRERINRPWLEICGLRLDHIDTWLGSSIADLGNLCQIVVFVSMRILDTIASPYEPQLQKWRKECPPSPHSLSGCLIPCSRDAGSNNLVYAVMPGLLALIDGNPYVCACQVLTLECSPMARPKWRRQWRSHKGWGVSTMCFGAAVKATTLWGTLTSGLSLTTSHASSRWLSNTRSNSSSMEHCFLNQSHRNPQNTKWGVCLALLPWIWYAMVENKSCVNSSIFNLCQHTSHLSALGTDLLSARHLLSRKSKNRANVLWGFPMRNGLLLSTCKKGKVMQKWG